MAEEQQNTGKDKEKQNSEESTVELDHFVESGIMVIDGTEYKISKGKVKIAQEHVLEAINHIKMGG